MKHLPIYLSLLLLLTCAKEDSQDPGTTPSNITPMYTLTASAGEGGSVSPTTGNFNAGTQVSVTATPNSGYTFSGWSNGSTDNPVTVTLNSNTSITANFALIPVYTITVSAEEGGSVSSEGGDYQEGTQVTITATPDEGYEFSGWSDGSTESTRVITSSEDLTLTASFSELIISYTLTVTSTEGGSVNSEGGEYNEGTEITLTASAGEGYRFIGWSDGSTEESITITLSEDTTLEALFELIPIYTVTVTGEGGVVTGEGDYQEGTEVTITASASEGYRFIGWSNDSTEESITITVNEDTSLEALFEIIKYTVNINNTVGGIIDGVRKTEGSGEYEHGTTVTLSAPEITNSSSGSSYIFLGWSGDINSNESIIEFEITSNISVTANFKDTVNFKPIYVEGEGEFIIDNYIYNTLPNSNPNVIGFDISIKEEFYDTFRGWTNLSVPGLGIYSISTNKEKKISINTKDRFNLNGELIGYRIGIIFQDFPGVIKTDYEIIPENFNGIPSYKFRKSFAGAQAIGYFSNETGEYIFIAPSAGDDEDKSEIYYGAIFKKIDGYWKFYKVDTGVTGWGYRQIKIIDNKYIIIGDGNELGDVWSGPIYYGEIDGENISWTMVGPEEEWAYFHGSGGDDINGDGLIDVGGTGNRGLRVYFQNPNGTFTDKSSSVKAIFADNNNLGGLPFGWDFGDVDGDGMAEIVSADYGGGDPYTNPRLNNISVIKYDQSDDIFNLHFLSNESTKLFDYGRGGEHVDIFDINNDGHNDIVVKGADYRGSSLESWINNGDGTFYAKWGEAFEGQYNLREFKMFDADNDGYLDIIPNTHGFITGNTHFLYDVNRRGLNYNQSIFFNDRTGSFARDLSKSYIDLYTKNSQTVSYMKDGKFHIFGMNVIQAEWRDNLNGNTLLILEDVQIDLD